MKTIKKTILLALAIILALSLMQICNAEELDGDFGEEIISEYQNASSASINLSISSGGTATITLYCLGKSGTTKISSTTYLKGYINGVWQTIRINGTNSASYSVNSALLSKNYSTAVSSGTYYAYTTYSVTRNGQTETFTVSSNTVSH